MPWHAELLLGSYALDGDGPGLLEAAATGVPTRVLHAALPLGSGTVKSGYAGGMANRLTAWLPCDTLPPGYDADSDGVTWFAAALRRNAAGRCLPCGDIGSALKGHPWAGRWTRRQERLAAGRRCTAHVLLECGRWAPRK